jgi:hypothetical protein
MFTGSVDIQGIAVLAHTFCHAEIGGMRAVFLAAFKINVNVRIQIFLLLGGRFDLEETMMRCRYNFLADVTMDLPAAGMSFE